MEETYIIVGEIDKIYLDLLKYLIPFEKDKLVLDVVIAHAKEHIYFSKYSYKDSALTSISNAAKRVKESKVFSNAVLFDKITQWCLREGLNEYRKTREVSKVYNNINTYYTRLGIEETASLEDIKNAYREKVLHHSNLNDNSDESKEEFVKIQRAYECLRDESRKRAYDVALKAYREDLIIANQDNNFYPQDVPDKRNEASKNEYSSEKYSKEPDKVNKFPSAIIIPILVLCILLFVIIFHAINNDVPVNPNKYTHTSTNKLYGDSIRKADSIAAVKAAAVGGAADEDARYNDNEIDEYEENDRYTETTYETGDIPYLAYFGRGKFDPNSLSKLTLVNYSSTDAVLLLVKISSGKVIRNVFVPNGESYIISKIPEGRYMVKVMYGNSWNKKKDNGDNFPKGGFMKNISFSQSKISDPFEYIFTRDEGGISYPTYQLTLHKVVNGNMRTEGISKSDFFR